MNTHPTDNMLDPSPADLAAIEAEWPVIAAELEITDSQCRLAASSGDAVAVRSHRRAVRRLLAVLAEADTAVRPTTRTAVVPVFVPVAAA